MTLEQALQYLEITSRVSCPQITCDQALEIAALIRRLLPAPVEAAPDFDADDYAKPGKR